MFLFFLKESVISLTKIRVQTPIQQPSASCKLTMYKAENQPQKLSAKKSCRLAAQLSPKTSICEQQRQKPTPPLEDPAGNNKLSHKIPPRTVISPNLRQTDIQA